MAADTWPDEGHCLVRRFAYILLIAVGGSAAELTASRMVEAAKNKDEQAVRTLIARKADVNARSSDGSTALLWLAHWNDAGTAELLLGAGADANAANDFGMTPL